MSSEYMSIAERSRLVDNAKKTNRLLRILIAILGTGIIILYIVSAMYSKFGSFTVTVSQANFRDYGIALCETKDFTKTTPILNCRASNEITNIDGNTLNNEDLGAIDGEDNGQDYLCYSFYLVNTGKKALDFNEVITITSSSSLVNDNLLECVRVRVISSYNGQNAETVTYAWPTVDENNNPVPETGTVAFYSSNSVLNNLQQNFNPGDYKRYTIVVWIEGPDKDCLDDAIGGEFKIDMNFYVDEDSVED